MFKLQELPYSHNALVPIISEETIKFHYGKHHQTYLDNLNNLLPQSNFSGVTSLEELIIKADGAIFNNAAQVWNHTFYWNCLIPGGSEIKGKIKEAIINQFGSVENFVEQFSKAAISLFGSGWAWLAKTPDGKLEIIQESNAGNPLRRGLKPLLTFDVWEHAYYLDKQNRRADYVKELWQIVNWDFVERNFVY